jgi:F0F1-type ATP synthase membrane subunit b/b'
MLMEVILPYANFFLFLAAAIYFFRKPAKNAALKRRQDFEKILAEASAARAAAEARLQELQARMSRLDAEIADIKSMSKQAGELEAKRIVQDAERLSTHLKEEAKRVAAAEVENARKALRNEIVAAVSTTVSGKIRSDLTPERQISLVKRQVGELQHIKAEG